MATDATARAGSGDAPSLPFRLQEREVVLQVCRKHWIFLWPRSIFMALVAIVPVIVVAWLLSWAGWFDGLARTIFFVAALVWLAWWAVRIFLNWYRWQNDIWVVTNQRIIDSLKPHPFSHRLSSADLINIQDMTVDRHGPLQTMLNFGDVICDTASGGRDFAIVGVPDPQSVQLLVDRERDRERTRGR